MPKEWFQDSLCTDFEYEERIFDKLLRMGVFKDCEEHRRFNKEILKFSRIFYPFASDPKHVEFIGEVWIWVFFIDDILELLPLNMKLFENQSLIWNYGQLPEDPLPVEVFTMDIRQQAQEFCGDRVDAFHRFNNTFSFYVELCVPTYETRGYPLNSYLKMRALSCGVTLCNSVIEALYLKELNTKIFYDPIYRMIEHHQSLVIGLVNDIFSYEKESKVEYQSQVNLVYIVQNNLLEGKKNLDQSLKIAVEIVREQVQSYFTNEKLLLDKYLPLMKTEQEKQDLITYFKYSTNIMSGNLCYSALDDKNNRYPISKEYAQKLKNTNIQQQQQQQSN
eukprot:gene7761-9552_t